MKELVFALLFLLSIVMVVIFGYFVAGSVQYLINFKYCAYNNISYKEFMLDDDTMESSAIALITILLLAIVALYAYGLHR